MSIRTTTKNVVRSWASIPPINNTLIELCVLWASGNPGQPCGTALPVLIEDLKQAFPTKNLDGLRSSDLMGSGSIKTVESLIGFIANSPSKALPFALVSTKALAQLETVPGARTTAKKSEKTQSKKNKTAGKKGRNRGGK